MKDPAVLFYFQDFLFGTEFMTDDEVGKYIRILCHQADKGALTEIQLKRICRCNHVPGAIMEKLKQDENGNYYQQRMKIEREKRINYSESRRKNRVVKEEDMKIICESYDERMENENEDINKEEKKGAKKFNFDFVEEQFKDVFNSWLQYKKERKETYKTQTSLEACYRNLKKLSDDNPEKANAIVENSFANNYSGLFPLKNNKPFTPIPLVPHFSSGPDK